ncbi:MAG: O-methyltransferase [Burkholderiales bacterium]
MPAPLHKSLGLSPELHGYLVAHGTPPDAVQRDLIAETAKLGSVAIMQVAPEQGAFLTLIAKMIGARDAVEIGTFTGYSSLAIARGLAPGGRLLCCDVSTEWTTIAKRAWQAAGVETLIDLRIAPAAETLRSLPLTPRFDLAFIDADKVNYKTYYEEILMRTRPGGLILVDNVLWNGAVINPEKQDENTLAIRAFNDAVAADARVDCVMTPISDGLTMLRKR